MCVHSSVTSVHLQSAHFAGCWQQLPDNDDVVMTVDGAVAAALGWWQLPWPEVEVVLFW